MQTATDDLGTDEMLIRRRGSAGIGLNVISEISHHKSVPVSRRINADYGAFSASESVLLEPITVCWCRLSNCLLSAAGPSQSLDPPPGTVRQRVNVIICPVSVDLLSAPENISVLDLVA